MGEKKSFKNGNVPESDKGINSQKNETGDIVDQNMTDSIKDEIQQEGEEHPDDELRHKGEVDDSVSRLLEEIRRKDFHSERPVRSSKGHLKGNQWRESKRALEKKERAKAKHVKQKTEDKRFVDAKTSFIISPEEAEGREYGIVTGLSMGRIKVLLGDRYYDCMIDQGLPFELGKILAVGDHVTINYKTDKFFVDHLIERKNVLSRLRRDSTRWGGDSAKSDQVIAANIDAAVIVVAAKNPPLHARFIDRYLVLIQHSKIEPIICVNKADLGIEDESILSAYRNIGIQIIETSTETGQGINELKQAIENKAVVLVGNSGVGKSSLINSIAPELSLRVSQVGEKSGKGRHTTTSSDLISWEKDSFIIDTPGIRSLGMANITRGELELYFDEIAKYSQDCKFSDCTHDTEEKCGVKEAVKKGLIDQQRYQSYLKILHEIS